MTAPSAPRVIFFGTPVPAARILDRIVESGVADVIMVVTAPDKPAGRNQTPSAPAVKTAALRHGIETLQPLAAKNPALLETTTYLGPDLFIVVAYGFILPPKLLVIPTKGALNIHFSLLPKFRGPSPVASAIAAGETTTGVTVILMDAEIDHGPVAAQIEYPIAPDATGETLTAALAEKGADLLIQTIPRWMKGAVTPKPQDHGRATFTKLLTKDDGRIDWSGPAAVIERLVRALHPWPGAWTVLPDGRRLKILHAAVTSEAPVNKGSEEGMLTTIGRFPAAVTGDGALILQTLQLEGKEPIDGAAFLNGYRDLMGKQLL